MIEDTAVVLIQIEILYCLKVFLNQILMTILMWTVLKIYQEFRKEVQAKRFHLNSQSNKS